MLIHVDDAARWRAALDDLPHGFWHRHESCRALALGSGLPTWLYVDADSRDGARVAMPFSERSHAGTVDIFTPGGFAGFAGRGNDTLRARWEDFVRERDYVCGYFALHPVVADPAMHVALGRANTLHLVDLSGGAESALAGFDRDARREVRRCVESHGPPITDHTALAAFARDHYHSFMAGVGARGSGVLPLSTLDALLDDPAVRLAGYSDDAGVCCVYGFARGPHGADALLNLSVRNGRRFVAALVAWGVSALAQDGLAWLNLGGGARDGDAIARAKTRFGTREHPLRIAREVYRPDLYYRLSADAGVSAGTASDGGGFFPAYRRG